MADQLLATSLIFTIGITQKPVMKVLARNIKDDKNSFLNKLDKVSAQINGYTGMDYASLE